MFFLKKKKSAIKNKLPEKLVALKHAAEPAWVWDAEYRIIVWSNISGLKFWGADNRNEIKELVFPDSHAMVVMGDAILKKVTQGKIFHKNMTLTGCHKIGEYACKIESQPLPDGRNGILICVNMSQSQAQKLPDNKALDHTQINALMLTKPATFSCDNHAMIVGYDDIAKNYLKISHGDPCISIFQDRAIGKEVIRQALSTPQSFNVQKIDIGFGVYPYLIQTTQFNHHGIPHFNMGILRITDEKYLALATQNTNQHIEPHQEKSDEPKDFPESQKVTEKVAEPAETQAETQVTQKNLFDNEAYLSSSVMGNLVGVEVGIFDVSINGTITMLNQMACHLTGHTEAMLIGKKITTIFSGEAQSVLTNLIEYKNQDILDDLTDGVECQYYDIHKAEHTAKLIVRHNQEKNGFWFILDDRSEVEKIKSDILDLKTIAKDIKVTSFDKNHNEIPSLVSAVSHEIRAPLNAIAGYAEMIENEIFGALPDDRYKEFASSIRGAGEYALSIINDLLDYSKLKAGGFTPQFTQVNIEQVANEAIEIVYPLSHSRNIEVTKTILLGTPPIHSDPRLLKQILVNLLTNAIKYSSDNEQVLLTVGPTKSGRIMIEITDFGRGMTDDEIHRALTPFNSDHNDLSGTGLGLCLSKELTELTNGRFTINSILGEKTRIRLIYDKSLAIEEVL
ncbi:MAG: PAS domain S-box-containing protein [Alphaproteobacteria bacterium]|jgi:PAS domain S-box-containing protein